MYSTVWICFFTHPTYLKRRAFPRPGTRITYLDEKNRSAVITNVPLWPWTRDRFLYRTNIYLVTWILESHCRVTSTWTIKLLLVVKCSCNNQWSRLVLSSKVIWQPSIITSTDTMENRSLSGRLLPDMSLYFKWSRSEALKRNVSSGTQGKNSNQSR